VAHVSAPREITRAVTAPLAAARPPALTAVAPAPAPALGRRLAGRMGHVWLPRAGWAIRRTGRLGLVGIGLLLAAAVFLASTYLKVASEVEALRAGLAAAPGPAPTPAADAVTDPAAVLRDLPPRADLPAILRQLFTNALQARLTVDSGKYEVRATKSSGVARYLIAFPVTGPYPQVRAFIDSTLATMPEVALSDVVLERKSIGDANVEAQIRLTVYTTVTGAPGAGSTATRRQPASPGAAATDDEPSRGPAHAPTASARVVAPTHAKALFAQHSWYVPPPPRPAPPPAAPPPPPPPTAPPFPYAFLGSFSPDGRPPVFFLARGDRVIDAHVGDRLDGVYQLESAGGGQLVFVYLPLNVRHTLAAGASK
jgi:hypothetical protein